MKKTAKKLLGVSLTAALMTGTSLSGIPFVAENFEPALYNENGIVIGGDTLSCAEFAENIEEHGRVWFYRDPKSGKLTDLNVLSDYRTAGDRRYRLYQNMQLKKHIDTIKVKKEGAENKLYYFYGPNDSIPNMPSMGSMDWDRLNLRHFVSDDPAVQKQLDIYNNALNCTERHETQHFLGAKKGLSKSGRSYETVFGDNCMDEVAANLAQLLEQRKNYITHGKDTSYITPRFAFYRKWLENNRCGADNISDKEAAFIANGIFDSWKKDKYPVYIKRNVNRAVHILREADYNGCQDRPGEHDKLMRDVFHINGIDFYQYIAGREREFIDDLPPEHKNMFAMLLKIKKQKMDYFQKVGQVTKNDPQRKYALFKNLKFKHEWNKFVGKLTGRG